MSTYDERFPTIAARVPKSMKTLLLSNNEAKRANENISSGKVSISKWGS